MARRSSRRKTAPSDPFFDLNIDDPQSLKRNLRTALSEETSAKFVFARPVSKIQPFPVEISSDKDKTRQDKV
eukprot:m.251247 g.251247  ORF g.251247 m.251247 type:complete len:72 (-) comp16146_c1_seq1:100-315(-)